MSSTNVSYEKCLPYVLYYCEIVVLGYVELGQQSWSCHRTPPETVFKAFAKIGLGVNPCHETSCECTSSLLSLAYGFLTVDRGVYIGLQKCVMFGVFL